MSATKIEEATYELLREAKKSRNQLCRMKTGYGSFVRCKHAYAEPEELRSLYLAAFDSLCLEGKLIKVLENDIFEIYEIDEVGCGVRVSMQDAMDEILCGLQRYGLLYKIHSNEGEFIQCGSTSYANEDDERIIYLEAVYRLMHKGLIQVVSDSKQYATYALSSAVYKAH
ncbi:MAG: hypothetical protein P4L53_21080 [Candidatus Obscuribacterales bacterium]|nr:hypothetical protein [Candidatus Obscuribacterales bacterium]